MNAAVHAKQRAVNAVKIAQNFAVKPRQFLVQADNSVALAFAAFFLVRTPAAVLALEKLLGSAVLVSANRPAVNVVEFFSVWTDWRTAFINLKIHRSVRVVAVFFILAFLFKHGEFHVLFYSVLFAVKVVVETSITRICNRIFGIFAIQSVEFFHQRLKTIHIRCVLTHVKCRDIAVANRALNVICGKKLVVAHVVALHSHESCAMVGLGVAATVFSTYFDVLRVLFQPFQILGKLFVQPLLRGFVMSAPANFFL